MQTWIDKIIVLIGMVLLTILGLYAIFRFTIPSVC
jgi:hypothetical protein